MALVAVDLVGANAWLNPQMDAALLSEPAWVATAAGTQARVVSGFYLANYYLKRYGSYEPDIDPDPDVVRPLVSAPPDTEYTAAIALAARNLGLYESQWGMHGVFTVDSVGLLPVEYHRFEQEYFRSSPTRRARALQRVGVRTIVRVGPPPGDFGPPEEIGLGNPASAYFSPEPFEPIFLAPSARVEPDSGAAIGALFDQAFDPRAEALLERDAAPGGKPGAPAPAAVQVLEDRANSIRVAVTAPEGATLVVLQSFNPGWRAEVDDVGAEIVRVDGLFQGVRLTPGQHTVSLVFRPASLIAGAWISAVTALALVALALVSARRDRAMRAREGV
jgi:hypothetical protein